MSSMCKLDRLIAEPSSCKLDAFVPEQEVLPHLEACGASAQSIINNYIAMVWEFCKKASACFMVSGDLIVSTSLLNYNSNNPQRLQELIVFLYEIVLTHAPKS